MSADLATGIALLGLNVSLKGPGDLLPELSVCRHPNRSALGDPDGVPPDVFTCRDRPYSFSYEPAHDAELRQLDPTISLADPGVSSTSQGGIGIHD